MSDDFLTLGLPFGSFLELSKEYHLQKFIQQPLTFFGWAGIFYPPYHI